MLWAYGTLCPSLRRDTSSAYWDRRSVATSTDTRLPLAAKLFIVRCLYEIRGRMLLPLDDVPSAWTGRRMRVQRDCGTVV
jgi:hypothetical protein